MIGKEAAVGRRATIFRVHRRGQTCPRDSAVPALPRGRRYRPVALALSLGGLVCSGTQVVADNANDSGLADSADQGVTTNTAATDPSNDATLSGLVLKDADSNAIKLRPAFASSTTLYWATVAHVVDQVTIAPKTNDDNATFGLLDGADDVLDDADDDADGFQVDLNEGANTIKVRVTAEDGTTSATYRVVVTRRVVVVSTLVSNAGQRLCTDPPGQWSQPFTTGGNAAGYTVTTVNVGISSAMSTYLVRLVPSTSDGRPDESDPSRFITLTNPARVATGVLNPFTAPSGTTLAASTTYHVMVTDTVGTGSAGRVKVTASPAEDSGSADGWVIDDTSYLKTEGATGWDASSTFYLWMAVQGYANVATGISTPSKLRSSTASPGTPEVTLLAVSKDDTGGPFPAKPPSAPRELTATTGDSQATFAWTAPLCDGSATIGRYEYSINQGTTWTDNGLDTQITLTGLTSGTSITFHVRAVNSAGEGSEASVTATLSGGTDNGGGSGGSGGGDGGGIPPPPVVEREIGPQTVAVGVVLEVDISDSFSSRDLDYTVKSADPSIATVEVTPQAVISVTGLARGATAITVTAADHQGQKVSQTFSVTVTRPWHVPFFPPAADSHGREGFVRIVNPAEQAGNVAIEAIDDTGVAAGTLTLAIEASSVAHFNSTDLENGSPEKGLSTGVGSGPGALAPRLDERPPHHRACIHPHVRRVGGLHARCCAGHGGCAPCGHLQSGKQPQPAEPAAGGEPGRRARRGDGRGNR